MEFHELINHAVSTIHSNESNRKRLAGELAFLGTADLSVCASPEVREFKMVFPCEPAALTGAVVGVDSGFVVKSLHSVDVVLVRAVGVCFLFQGGVLKSAEYEPGFFSFPKPFLFGGAVLDLHELEQSKSLVRLGEEIDLATKMIRAKKPAFCLLDGSLIPQYADKPPKESGLTNAYHRVLSAFATLYRTAQENDCELVGCVEDSRGNRFAGILADSILPVFGKKPSGLDVVSDSVLLSHVLSPRQRSMAFSYTKNVSKHPILNDLAPWGDKIFACYLRPSALDRPLRIEFLHSQGDFSAHVDRVSHVIMALASLHREYAYPSVLIEADLRARLKPEEIDLVFNKITDKLSHNVALQLRRNSRPF
ncbi:MAG: DNA double-strand break repair nuclease NurA [Candidatus Diapherotrites archaeon]|nr:DNA double-strand break repair nuclease NurA [Candidatus Diapherotrites archaeon]